MNKPKQPVSKPTRKWWLVGAGVLVLAGTVWGVTVVSKHRKAALPKDLTVEALKADSYKDPGQVFERVHDAMRQGNLSEDQRHQVFENARTVMEARMDERVDQFLAAKTEAEKRAILDRDIDQMQARMKEWQQRRQQWQQEHAAQGGQSGAPRSGGPAPSAGPRSSGGPAPAGGAVAAGPGGDRHGPGGPGGRQHSRQDRKEHSEARDPNKRAARMAYFTAMQQRATQRGVAMPFGGGGPRGGH